MTRIYQPKYLPGTNPPELNPKYKPRRGRKSSGPSGKKLSKFERGNFIAWDGEGITKRDGSHKYIMLCTSARGVASLTSVSGLSTVDCLNHILAVAENNPGAIHVAFGASYDVNMILADCPRSEIESVWSGEWTAICGGQFSVSYRARKSFSIRRAIPKFANINGKIKRVDNPAGVVLWDVFGFFQSSFVDACEKYLGKDYPQLDFVREQKKIRQSFKLSDQPEIERYCLIECHMLVALMKQLKEYLTVAELPIRRWDGAGACAASLLQRENVLDHKRLCMESVREAAQYAYAGGRMELARYGHAPDTPIYHYDINSAYPTAMCSLPSLQAGRWIKGDGSYRPEYPFSMYRVDFEFPDSSLYPLFWRSHNCSIYYPQSGSGWYWQPEIEVAFIALESAPMNGRGHVTIRESFHFIGDDTISPFEFLPKLYEQRKQWKSEGIGAEKVIKLAINSLYGKTAQQAGGVEGAPPRYHQLEWAGYITSYTRAMLYRAMLPAIAERNIIMCATDGIYSLQPLDVPTGDQLGQWEYKKHSGVTVVQSGVYWTHESDGEPKAFCRGFDKGSLNISKIVAAWKKHKTYYDASLTRFVTMGSALAGHASFEHWRKWRKMPRKLALTTANTKRYDELAPEDWTRNYGPHCALVHTHAAVPAAQIVGQVMSAKYPLLWVDGDEVNDALFDGAPLRIIEQEAYDAFV